MEGFATIKLTEPENVDCTLTVVLPLKDWKALKAQLGASAYPGWKLCNAIGALIEHAESRFHQKISYPSSEDSVS